MKRLYPVLMRVYEDPVSYLGKISLDRLADFISGYCTCVNEVTLPAIRTSGFSGYVIQQYGLDIRAQLDWHRVIRFFCNSEEQAFYRFYELYRQYIEEREKTIQISVSQQVRPREKDGKASLTDLLEQIRQKPVLFFGRPSLAGAYAMLNGYCTRLAEEGIFVDTQGFQKYVEDTYNVHSGQCWEQILQLYYPDVMAFPCFLDLYDRFTAAEK